MSDGNSSLIFLVVSLAFNVLAIPSAPPETTRACKKKSMKVVRAKENFLSILELDFFCLRGKIRKRTCFLMVVSFSFTTS